MHILCSRKETRCLQLVMPNLSWSRSSRMDCWYVVTIIIFENEQWSSPWQIWRCYVLYHLWWFLIIPILAWLASFGKYPYPGMSAGSLHCPCSVWDPTHSASVSSTVKLIHKEYPRVLSTLFCLIDEPQHPAYNTSHMEIDIHEKSVAGELWQWTCPSLHNYGYNDIRVSLAIWVDLFRLHCALWNQ